MIRKKQTLFLNEEEGDHKVGVTGPTVPQGQKHRVNALRKSRGPRQNPAEPR